MVTKGRLEAKTAKGAWFRTSSTTKTKRGGKKTKT